MTLMTTAPADPTYSTERGITLAELQAEAALVRHEAFRTPDRTPGDNAAILARILAEPIFPPASAAATAARLAYERDLAAAQRPQGRLTALQGAA